MKSFIKLIRIAFLITAIGFCLAACSSDTSGGSDETDNKDNKVDNTIYSIRDAETALALVAAIYSVIDGSINYDALYNDDDSDDTPSFMSHYGDSGYIRLYGVSYYDYLYGSQYYQGKTRNNRYHKAAMVFNNYIDGNLELTSGQCWYEYKQRVGGFVGNTIVRLIDPCEFKFTYKNKKYAGTVYLERERSQTDSWNSVTTIHRINYLYIDDMLIFYNRVY